ncbi:hypothetical protein D3C76_1302250 [compost metagenome]
MVPGLGCPELFELGDYHFAQGIARLQTWTFGFEPDRQSVFLSVQQVFTPSYFLLVLCFGKKSHFLAQFVAGAFDYTVFGVAKSTSVTTAFGQAQQYQGKFV